MSTPRVTVAIPTYNRARMLSRAVTSVLEQSSSDLELFVCDNASTDDTRSMVESIGDARIRYIRHDRNLGASANLSFCVHVGSAPYLEIMPDDDWLLPGSLEQKAELLDRHPDVGLVHSAVRRVVEGEAGAHREVEAPTAGKSDRFDASARVVREIITGRYSVDFQSALVRRSIIRPSDGFSEEFGGADDEHLFLHLVHRSGNVAYLATPLLVEAYHPGAASTEKGRQDLIGDEYLATFENLRERRYAREQFLHAVRAELLDYEDLVAANRRQIRRMLASVAGKRAGAGHPVTRVARLLAQAARVDPLVLSEPSALRLLASSVVGGRARDLARRLRVPAS